MPYKIEKINLKGLQDRRRKLTDEQREEIKRTHEKGGRSLNSLAAEYGVSKKTILLIVNPESEQKSKDRIKKHWKDYQPSREERARIMREHRKYKQELYLKGELKDEQE